MQIASFCTAINKCKENHSRVDRLKQISTSESHGKYLLTIRLSPGHTTFGDISSTLYNRWRWASIASCYCFVFSVYKKGFSMSVEF